MTLSRFFADPETVLIADASAVINLIATQQAEIVLRTLPHSFLVTDNAWAELERGALKGYSEAARLAELESEGLVRRVFIGDCGISAYEDLISGSTVATLDDGEAATIAYSREVSGIALIDERKARTICATAYRDIEIVSTVELLLHPAIKRALGKEAHGDAIFNALQHARMRVPPSNVSAVVTIIGSERAKTCVCLPKSHR